MNAGEILRTHRRGERAALRRAIFEIEKLGIERRDWERVKACLESMIADVPAEQR